MAITSGRCALTATHVYSRRLKQPCEGFLGLLGLRPGEVNRAIHLAELLHKPRTAQTAQHSIAPTKQSRHRCRTRVAADESILAKLVRGERPTHSVVFGA